MSGIGVFFSKSEGERRAEQARQDAEDRLMQVHPLEKTNLSFHCDAEAERAIVFITRLREIGATSKTRGDRNFYATLAIGAALLTKGTPALDWVWHALLSVVGAV